MYNELIIGLGGCGGRSIQAFRRTAELRAKDYEEIKKKGTRIDYLYIDSNDDILKADGWTVYGKSIKLEASQFIHLKQDGVQNIDAISESPNIKPWIGDIKDSFRKRSSNQSDEEVRNALQSMAGAGQLRRYGRALFAMSAAQVRSTLESKITALTSGRQQEIWVRIFCTLGGGTGSGSLIDTVTLIRKLCEDHGVMPKILVYVYVAAAKGKFANAGSFYENEYCSLRDLNALMVYEYNPLITCSQFSDYRDAEFNSKKGSVTRVFISSEVAPGAPDLKKQVENVTAACFDSIVYAHCGPDPDCFKAISDEDLVVGTEGETNKGQLVRSYRFGTLGSRRWRVPTTQIRELLNRDMEARVCEALLKGNKLPDDIGRDTSKLEGFNCEFVLTRTAEVYQEVEDELITPIRELFRNMMAQKRRDSQVLSELRDVADNQLKLIKKLPNDNKKKLALIESHKVAVSTIEKSFVTCADEAIRWGAKADVWGLLDVKTYLTSLRNTLSQWADTYVPHSSDEDMAAIREGVLAKMNARETEWEKLGFLTIQLTKLDERMMEAQCEDAVSLVLNEIKSYKRLVINDLAKKVDEMLRRIEYSLDAFVDCVKGICSNALSLAGSIDSELRDNGEKSEEGKCICDKYAYDAANLKDVREAMDKQYETLKSDMVYYSEALKDAVGEGHAVIQCDKTAFDSFKLEMDSRLINDTTTKIHDEACRAIAKDSVLVGDIIERLAQIGGNISSNWDEKLGDEVSSFMANMPVCATIEGNDGLQNPQSSPCAAIVIGLPKTNSHPDLVIWLKKKLMSSKPNKYYVMRSEFYEHSSKEEIRVLYIPYWMPCRFMKVTEYVEKIYLETINKTDETKYATCYFANYDITGEDFATEFHRPALTKASEPDMDNVIRTEVIESLFVKVKGVKKSIVKKSEGSRNISFVNKIDKLEGVKYAAPHAETKIKFPSSSYRDDMAMAIRLAVEPSSDHNLYMSMSDEEKLEVFNAYQAVVEELENSGKQGSPEYEQAAYKRTLVRNLLKLKS